LDTVKSAITYTLGNNVENLILTGDAAINGTGNALDNTIIGNKANNVLTGMAGNDTYYFESSGGNDTIIESGADSAFLDRVLFGKDILKETVAFFQNGTDLIVGYGNDSTIRVSNQTRPDFGIEKIELGNGQFLTDANINQIIQDIAAFAGSSGISLNNINDVKHNPDLMTLIGNSWHS
jgi:Ca2+-binding RTX toxin-like protein